MPDVSGVVADLAGRCPACRSPGINTGVFTVPQIGAGVWIEFEQGDPDYPIWVGGFWGTAAEVPVLAHAVPPAVNGITIQTTLKNGIVVSDVPGPTGGILIQTTTGAMISVSDVGIVISNGKGAVINMTRADRRHQRRRADGDLRRMPAPVLHLGAVVHLHPCRARRRRSRRSRACCSPGQPAVTIASPYVVAGCALTGTPNPPCVTGQWIVGRRARPRRRRSRVAHDDRQLDLRPDRHADDPLVARSRG